MISSSSLILLGLLLLNVIIQIQSAPVHLISTEKKKRDAQDTSAHVDKSVNSDLNMNSNQLINLLRKRRNTHEQLNKRYKREFYDTDPLYEALFIKPQSLIRPSRPFAPILWSPSSLERNIRLALETSFYEPSELNKIYPNTVEVDGMDTDRNPFYINDYDDEPGYEYNRYPIPFDIPYDNLQLQQEYNTDDLPMDDDGPFLPAPYNPFDDYFK